MSLLPSLIVEAALLTPSTLRNRLKKLGIKTKCATSLFGAKSDSQRGLES